MMDWGAMICAALTKLLPVFFVGGGEMGEYFAEAELIVPKLGMWLETH